MKVWILKHGEQLPLKNSSRIYRMGMIANECIKNNNEVIWWTSDFNHAYKKLEDKTENYSKIQFKFLSGLQYRKNVSIRRIINHYQLGKRLMREFKKETTSPDIIIASMPTIDFAFKAVKYGIQNDVPVVVDIRDLWPDVFKDLIPLSPFKNDIFYKISNKKLEYIIKNSTALTTITEEYLQWGLKKGDIQLDSNIHHVFPIGYEKNTSVSNGSKLQSDFLNIIFIGTIGRHFDLETLLEVANETIDKKIKYYIIGDGDRKEELQAKYENNNIEFTGWLSGEELTKYLNEADIGIAPYLNTKNFILNVPNKYYEYMAHGIPVISCLPGPSQKLISENEIGLHYEEGSSVSLKENIIYLLENKNVKKRFSENAIKLFNDKFTTNKIYRDYYSFIEDVVEESVSKKGELNEKVH